MIQLIIHSLYRLFIHQVFIVLNHSLQHKASVKTRALFTCLLMFGMCELQFQQALGILFLQGGVFFPSPTIQSCLKQKMQGSYSGSIENIQSQHSVNTNAGCSVAFHCCSTVGATKFVVECMSHFQRSHHHVLATPCLLGFQAWLHVTSERCGKAPIDWFGQGRIEENLRTIKQQHTIAMLKNILMYMNQLKYPLGFGTT